MMRTDSIHFELGVVEAALCLGELLYVRTPDAVAQVTRAGQVKVLHTFAPQSPLVFKGLVSVDGTLLTLDRRPNQAPVLTEVTRTAEVRQHPALLLHHPVGLAVADGTTVILDQHPPGPRVIGWHRGTDRLISDARNLSCWKQLGAAVWWSDAGGLHRFAQGRVHLESGEAGILAFDQHGHRVTQKIEDGWPVVRVTTPAQTHSVGTVGRPAAIHQLGPGTFVRFGNRIAPVSSPTELHELPRAADLGTVAELQGGLAYVDDDRRLCWSSDTRDWEISVPGVRASDLVAASASDLVVTGRRASVWVSAVQG